LSRAGYLLDVNILIAMTDPEHVHHELVVGWFERSGRYDWGVCVLTETGFVRVAANPRVGLRTVDQAIAMLSRLSEAPGYRYWPMADGWVKLTAPFSERIFGHQQVTDAMLLGLAIQENGVLVTIDKGIAYMAGPEWRRNVLVLNG
jgi:toxin-antitoxin system PIN domain toxin